MFTKIDIKYIEKNIKVSMIHTNHQNGSASILVAYETFSTIYKEIVII